MIITKRRLNPVEIKTPRVFCIGMNYRAHVAEMKGKIPERPVVFLKPYTSLVRENQDLVFPSDQGAIHHEIELVVLIGKSGKNICAGDAEDHIAGITLGLDLTLRDVQRDLKQRGLPWEISKGFDGSAPIGRIMPYTHTMNLHDISMQCTVNGELRQQGHTGDMIFTVAQLIEHLSTIWQLEEHDLIFTGTPPGVGPLKPGDHIAVESPDTGQFTWKVIS